MFLKLGYAYSTATIFLNLPLPQYPMLEEVLAEEPSKEQLLLFLKALVEAEGVLLLPGSVFEHPGNHFRIGLGRTNLPEALEHLEAFAARRLR